MHAKRSCGRQGCCQGKSADCSANSAPVAVAQAEPALKAVAQAGVLPKEAAAQPGSLPNAAALAKVLRKMASASAGRALRGRLPKQRLLRYQWSSTAKSETKSLVTRAF